MGGTVAVTLRTPDGTEYRMNRWTNTLPWFINNIRLVKKKKKHIDNYLEQWRLMQKDWEKHKEDKKFEHNMTLSYAPFPAPLAPEGYGLVVIDMVNNQILSSQGYCRFGYLNMAAILNDKNDRKFEIKDESNYFRAEEFFKKKRASYIRLVERKEKPKFQAQPTGLNFQQLVELIEKYEKKPTKKKYRLFTMSEVWIDLSPFVVKYYNKCTGMLPDLKGLGFKIDSKEKRLWKTWQKEMESDDED